MPVLRMIIGAVAVRIGPIIDSLIALAGVEGIDQDWTTMNIEWHEH